MKAKHLISAAHEFSLTLGKRRHTRGHLRPRPARGAARQPQIHLKMSRLRRVQPKEQLPSLTSDNRAKCRESLEGVD